MKSAPREQSISTACRSAFAWLLRSFVARALVGVIGFSISVLWITRSAGAENTVELKTSEYFNLTPGGVLHAVAGQTGSSVGVVPEGEVESPPQSHLKDDTVLAVRVAIN